MTASTDPDLLDTITAVIDGMVFSGGTQGPRVAALGVLGQEVVADGLAALPKLAAVTRLHTKRTWADGRTTVCGHCEKAWPCPTAERLGVTA